jgi:hypothetical protein
MNTEPQVPTEIQGLISEGLWPAENAAAQKQNLKSVLSAKAVRRFASEESMIFLYAPPFATVRMMMAQKKSFWSDPRSAVHEIDPDRTVIIGDFGPGSDAAIALDYRGGQEPSVIRLRWATEGNHWVEVAPDLKTFVSFLKS